GLLLAAIFGALLVFFRTELHEEVRRTVIGRDAAALQPAARQQVAAAEARAGSGRLVAADLPAAVLPSAQQEGMLAVAVFDRDGNLVRAIPDTLLFAELPVTDYFVLLQGGPISRFHAGFPLDRYFRGAGAGATAPVLEVLLPLQSQAGGPVAGFAQYYLDARALEAELAAIAGRLRRQTAVTFGAAAALLALVLGAAHWGLVRAQRAVAERNERLARAGFELTLAAKASALGQITSHLIHGLQGSVAGLRSAVRGDRVDAVQAARHAEAMEALIAEVVGLLGDVRTGAVFELRGEELADVIRHRASAIVAAQAVALRVTSRLPRGVENHRGSLLCLIASNLVQNAALARPGGRVDVDLREEDGDLILTVADDGPGLPEAIRARLFEPGVTGRAGGTGLGLAISRLLARQIDGDLELVNTGPLGTVFRATVPRGGRAQPVRQVGLAEA
ncbi:MAG TPA: sensor histidine kinase, partial [Opitutaceae bacterium]|nr:sensor histidine kinase [Opitutaceae bacterium]